MVNNIGILVPHGKYFAADHLCKALNATMFSLKSENIECDHLIIIGCLALVKYSNIKDKKFKSVAVIFSDTNFCIHHRWCNKYVKKHNIPVYAMPDLHDYLTVPYIPAYQTITLPDVEVEKPYNPIIICHSPGAKGKYNYKGTKQINEIVKSLSNDYNIEYKCLTNLKWEDCIKEKSTANIFVDQIVKGNPHMPQKRFGGKVTYNGALGKSGIEAMLLGCCTITTMNQVNTEPYFPFPPILNTTYTDLGNCLRCLIEYSCERNMIAQRQYEWAKKYCSPEFVAMNVTRHMHA